MTNFLRFLQVLALGTWIGSIFYFSAVIAPTAFAVLPSKEQAGLLVGPFALAAAFVGIDRGDRLSDRGGSNRGIDSSVREAGNDRRGADGAADRDFAEQGDAPDEPVAGVDGSVEKTVADDPRRVEFDRLHSVSVGLEGAVFLIGLAALYLTMKRPIE